MFKPNVGLRLYDTFISDENGYSALAIYIICSILLTWSKKLKKMPFEDIMIFLQ